MPAPLNDYVGFSLLENLDKLTLLVAAKASELKQLGGPANEARAFEVQKAYVKLTERIEAIALDWSAKGTAILRENERESRVRPDTLGQGGPRLGDFLFAEALPGLPGSVGTANEDILDENVRWWPTQEFGNSTNVGRILFGVFFNPGGAETRPDAGSAQQHALFEPRGRGEYRGSGEITHPIAPKRFIETSHREIDTGWSLEIDAALAQFVASLP